MDKQLEKLKMRLALLKEDDEITIEPPKEKENSTVYNGLSKIVPKNNRVKAAYASVSKSDSIAFLYIVEVLDKKDDEFYGRAALVVKHDGKVIHAAASHVQRAATEIPLSLFKMIPYMRSSAVPGWVKSYL